ncbi:MAG: DnaJ domain-containing protein [Oscillospiraceae bacterium]|jgi:GGDEF domain-containing protein|nr:DnaJ domain-containing protein [Oscillospiraceae bacterium]
MELWEDYYGLLQVHPQAGPEVIQSAYKRLCRMVHPDVNPDPAAAKTMQRINRAYEVLSNDNERRRYHSEWSRRSGTGGSPRVEVRERVVYINREDRDGGTPAAAAAVRDYFGNLRKRDYKSAYALVSEEDKACFGYGAYVEWQESVGALYEVGDTRLKLFKRYAAFKTTAGSKLPAEEYTVTLSEKDKITGRVSEYTLTKYAVMEKNGIWRVYLGYRDLTPLKLQFKAMASNPKEAQLLTLWEKHKAYNDLNMGMPNRLGLEESLEREIYRHKRYGRPFALGLFSVMLPDHVTDAGLRERVMKYAGYVISAAVRCIDSAAWLGDGVFAVLLAETDKSRAALAIRRISKTVRHDISACFDFDIAITAGATNYNGQNTGALIDACTRAIGSAARETAGQDSTQVEAL